MLLVALFCGKYEEDNMKRFFFLMTLFIMIFSVSSCSKKDQVIISYNTNGGVEIDSDVIDDNQTDFNLPIPTRIGYTFMAWYIDQELMIEYTDQNVPTSSFTLYAKWLINEYTITFITNGGSDVLPISKQYQQNISEPQDPYKEGYSFIGWFTEQNLINEYLFVSMPPQNLTLYAKWAINEYTITFVTNGGSSIIPIVNEFHEEILEPTSPIKEGYLFGGWFTDTEFLHEYQFGIMPSENITLYAKWILEQSNFDFDDALQIYENQVFHISEDYEKDTLYYFFVPEKSGYYTINSLIIEDVKVNIYNESIQYIGYQYLYDHYSNIEYIYFIENELYYLAVTDINENDLGSFDLSVSFISENNDIFSTAETVNIEEYNSIVILPNQNKLYKFISNDEQFLVFNFTTMNDVFVEVYDENGYYIARSYSNEDSFDFYVMTNGTYYINIHSNEEIENAGVDFIINKTIPENLDFDTALEIAKDQTLQYTLFIDDCLLYYVIHVSDSGFYQFSSQSNHDFSVTLYDSEYYDLDYDDDSGENNNFMLTLYFEKNMTYYFEINLKDHWGLTTFKLSLSFSNQTNHDFQNASLVNIDILYNDTIYLNGEQLFYKFYISQSGNYQIISQCEENILFNIYSSDFVYIADFYLYDHYSNFSFTELQSGEYYYIEISFVNQIAIGNFNFKIMINNEINTILEDAILYNLNDPNEILTTSLNYINLYSFIPESTGDYFIEYYSYSSIDTEWYDENGYIISGATKGFNCLSIPMVFGLNYYFVVLSDGSIFENILFEITQVDNYNTDFNNAKKVELEEINNVIVIDYNEILYYRFEPLLSGEYQVFSSGYLPLFIELYDEDFYFIDGYGSTWMNNNFIFNYTFDAGSIYYFIIGVDNSSIGKFDFMIHQSNNVNIDMDKAEILLLNNDYHLSISNYGEQLYYEFIPQFSGIYRVNISNIWGLGVLITDGNEHVVESDSTQENFDFIQEDYYLVKNQSYYFMITFYDYYSFGHFVFKVSLFNNIEDDFVTAIDIYSGDTVNIVIENNEQMFYKFTPQETGEYILLSSGNIDTYITIYNEEGYILDKNDDFIDLNFTLMFYFEAGETYYLSIKLYTYSTNHSFIFSLISANFGFSSAEMIHKDESKTVDIANYNDYRCYKFQPMDSETLMIFSYGNYDTMILIFDSNYNLVSIDISELDNSNFKLYYPFIQNRIYYFVVLMVDRNEIGTFNIYLCQPTIEADELVFIQTDAYETIEIKFVPLETATYSLYIMDVDESYYASYEIDVFDSSMSLIASDDHGGWITLYEIWYDLYYNEELLILELNAGEEYTFKIRPIYDEFYMICQKVIPIHENVYTDVFIDFDSTSYYYVYEFTPSVISPTFDIYSIGNHWTYISIHEENGYFIEHNHEDFDHNPPDNLEDYIGKLNMNFHSSIDFEYGKTYYIFVGFWIDNYTSSGNFTFIITN